MKPGTKKEACVVLVSSVLICLVIGIAYCWSVFEKALVQKNGWSNTQASLPYSVFMLFYAVSMLLGGHLQRRLGIRRTCMLGSSILVMGLALSWFSCSVPGVTLGFGVLGGLGQAMCYSCVVSTPLKWVSADRRGLAAGATTGAVGVSSIYMTPLITAAIDKNGVPSGFFTMLLIVAPVVLLLSHCVTAPPSSSPGGGKTPACSDTPPSMRELFGNRTMYKIFFLSFSCSLYGQIIVGHIANIAYVQIGTENGHFFVVLLAAFNCIGRFSCGVLSDYIPGPRLLQIIYSVGAANILLFVFYQSWIVLAIGTALIGFGYGASHSVVPAIISGCFGAENFSFYFGVTSLAAGFAGTCGPLLAGFAIDSSGTYLYAYLVGAVCLGLAAFVAGKIKLAASERKEPCGNG